MKNISAWKTTSIGLVLIAGGIASVYTGKADWTGALLVIGAGVGLVFSPDTFIDKLTKKND
jgi:hypothetical protein